MAYPVKKTFAMKGMAISIFTGCCISAGIPVFTRAQTIDKVKFFSDTAVISATITTDTRKLFGSYKKKGYSLPATFTSNLDGKKMNERILLEVRGNFRREYCYLPPLKVNFKYDPSSPLYPLKSLKLVSKCRNDKYDEQLLLKEFIIYRIYNLLTDKSFRVRLLRLNFADSSGRKKEIDEFAFLLEDLSDLAKRNRCMEWKKTTLKQEATDHRQMTLMAIFEYMIGNTDWSVTGGHNSCQIVPIDDSIAVPLAVPYDFDFSGLVDTDYSIPDEKLNIENVKQRLYRGYPRTLDEINEVLDIFKKQKKNIYSTINHFNLLNPANKKGMIKYLEEFYNNINSPVDVKYIFITDARTD